MTAVKELRKWKIDEITNLQGKSCLALIKELLLEVKDKIVFRVTLSDQT
jgi:hypothetical protein